MQVSGNFASDSNWIRPLPTEIIKQCTGTIRWRCRFYEFQTRKWTVGAFVLVRVRWHCTGHYIHNCMYSAAWLTTIISIPIPMSKTLPEPERAFRNVHILQEEHSIILIIAPNSSLGCQLQCIFYHLVLINLCVAPCLPHKGFLL